MSGNEATFGWARLGVVMASDDPYAPLYREAIEHAGLRVEWLEECSPAWLETVDVLLLCGYGELSATHRDAIHEWVGDGGSLVCSGGTWGLEETLGVQPNGMHASSAQLRSNKKDRLWPPAAVPARFFGGTLCKPAGCETVATANGLTAVSRHRVHRGAALFVGPHIGQTLTLMQMGRSVESDAIGPSDGSARLDDGVLRAEDATHLDFDQDRTTIEGCAPFFGQPHADVVRECWIRAVLNACDLAGVSVPMLWMWPRHAAAVATLSFDCELFDTDSVFRVYRTLAMFGCAASWVVKAPGFSLNAFRAIRAWDHEVALLFDTDDAAGWHEERLKIQLTAMRRASARPQILAFRPVDGKWRGLTRAYELAEAAGARLCMGRGGRQPGTMGFLFGTCHPYFPMRRDGSSFYVAELPTTLVEPGEITKDPVCDALLEQTLARHGCLHMVTRPESFDNPTIFASVRRLLSLCKQNRLEFMLPEEIFHFEKARRALRVAPKGAEGGGVLQLSSDTEVHELSVLVSGPQATALVRGREVTAVPVERFGTRFTALTVRLEAKKQVEIVWNVTLRKSA